MIKFISKTLIFCYISFMIVCCFYAHVEINKEIQRQEQEYEKFNKLRAGGR